MNGKDTRLHIALQFEGETKEDRSPKELVAYVFDAKGKYITQNSVDNAAVSLQLGDLPDGMPIRIIIAPMFDNQDEIPTREQLEQVQAYERVIRLNPRQKEYEFTIVKPDWLKWLRCRCTVRGRVVKRVPRLDGTVDLLPVCNTRVTICEVDALPNIIWRLPDNLVYRLRDDLIKELRHPILPPIPEPIDPIDLPPFPVERIELNTNFDMFGNFEAQDSPFTESLAFETRGITEASVVNFNLAEGMSIDDELKRSINQLVSAPTLNRLRDTLIESLPRLQFLLCRLPWWQRWVRYTKQCLWTAEVDEQGRFSTTITYPCFGDKPDLYFQVEQWRDMAWHVIYKPPMCGNIYWNYNCGQTVTLVITDPSAEVCIPDEPVDLPEDVDLWVMPYAVGNSPIWGDNAMGSAPNGWVRTDGTMNYNIGGFGTITNAPFGGTIGFQMNHDAVLPIPQMKYYRWSYRKQGASQWTSMNVTITRRYVKEEPSSDISFPAYVLGPKTVNGTPNLFEFRPHNPPAPDASDPAGTVTYWPVNAFFGDIYAAILNTNTLPPNVASAAGVYDIKLEVFNENGQLVAPNTVFDFVVPESRTSTNIITREAENTELDVTGFVFHLHIDNNNTHAGITPVRIGSVAQADKCGFLYYDIGDQVTIRFNAEHPNDHAFFNFYVKRGSSNLSITSARDDVGTTPVGAYNLVGGGYQSNFSVLSLMTDNSVPPHCRNAAFVESLRVYAKATNGVSRLHVYDRSALLPFALAIDTTP